MNTLDKLWLLALYVSFILNKINFKIFSECRRQDGKSLLMRLRTDVIEKGMAILAIVGGKLCGLFINAQNLLTENDR